MSSFSGECWIADVTVAVDRPEVGESGFGADWVHIGHIEREQDSLWKQFKTQAWKKTAGFYIAIMDHNMDRLPAHFWLGVEWLTGQWFATAAPATPKPLAARPPKAHPGQLSRPAKYLSAHVTAPEGGTLFDLLP